MTTYNGKTAECVVHVTPAPKLVELAAADGRTSFGVKETAQLEWKIDGRDGSVKFATSNKRIATVSAAGVVSFKKTGKVTIKATAYNGVYATLVLSCKAAPKSVSLGATRATLGLGETADLTATLSKNSAGSYSFTSSNPAVISVTGTIATALQPGSAVLTVTAYNGKKASKTITVCPAPESVAFDPAEITLGEGETGKLNPVLNAGSAGACSYVANNDHVSVDADGTLTAGADTPAGAPASGLQGLAAY